NIVVILIEDEIIKADHVFSTFEFPLIRSLFHVLLLLLVRACRQGEAEYSPLAGRTLNFRCGMMAVENMFNNREAQTRSPFFPAPTFVYPIKALEDTMNMFFRYTLAGVLDARDHAI